MERSFASAVFIIAVLAAALLAPHFTADELLGVGDAFQVNTYWTGQQGLPEIAASPAGDFVVVWESSADHDGNSWGSFAQRFDGEGMPLGAEMQLNTHTTDLQVQPFVTMGAQGDFLAVWQSFGQDGDDFGVFGQRFNADGTARGSEFQVNSYTTNYQGHPTAAIDDTGRFLIVWESDGQDASLAGIYGQLYDAAGAEIGNELQIHTTTMGDQNDPRPAVVGDGFVVVWESGGGDNSGDAVVMQALENDGDPIGGEVIVNTATTGDQEDPVLAVSGDRFAVVWESDGQDGSGEGIYAQVFDLDGMAVGQEFRLNERTSSDQADPSVSIDGAGGFVAVWESFNQVGASSEDDVVARRFDTAGNPIGSEFRVNTTAINDQDNGAVAGTPNGEFVVVWRAYGNQDGQAAGVFGKRYEVALFADGFESGDTSSWSATVP